MRLRASLPESRSAGAAQRRVAGFVLLALAPTVMAPAVARAAACGDVSGCLSLLANPLRLDARTNQAIAALVVPTLALAASVSELRHINERALPEGVVTVAEPDGRVHLELALIPPAPALPIASDETPPAVSRAFRINEAATHVMLGVGGAAVLAGIVAGIAAGKK